MTADEALDSLVAILQQLRALLPQDKDSWDERLLLQLAVERLWITAGNLAEAFRIERGIATGIYPWSELVGYRNLLAHALPGDVSSDRVFFDTASDLGRLLDDVRAQPS